MHFVGLVQAVWLVWFGQTNILVKMGHDHASTFHNIMYVHVRVHTRAHGCKVSWSTMAIISLLSSGSLSNLCEIPDFLHQPDPA